MSKKPLSKGALHPLPADLSDAILADDFAHSVWEDITPLARNEWICWVSDAKKPETRARRIEQTISKMHDGKRRPCCWPGCRHR